MPLAHRLIPKQDIHVREGLHLLVLEVLAQERRAQVHHERSVLLSGVLAHLQDRVDRNRQEEAL